MSAQPNLTKYTEEEIFQTMNRVLSLRSEGKYEEAEKLMISGIPLLAEDAEDFKQEDGIEILIEEGYNLSKAVEKYGEQWLEEYR